MTSLDLQLADETATAHLAHTLAVCAPHNAVVYLQGDLGAGKSTLARAWLRRCGVQGAIRSPTYTLVERYPLHDGGEALHLDLYRIADAAELDFLGLDDADARLWLIEWPERGTGCLPAPDLVVQLAVADGQAGGRSGRLLAGGAAGQAWLERLQQGSGLRPLSDAKP